MNADKTPDIDTDNPEFQNALALLKYTRHSVFLTGKAGTGKSTFLRYICKHIHKRHVVLAPTGIAAINAGGSTIHSFFKMPLRPILPDDPDLQVAGNRIFNFLKYNKLRCDILREVELIIIDEISMVRADMIDFIDRVLRVFSHNMRDPFGGKQLLLVGDVYQLEPVVTADFRDILAHFYPTPFFFSAKVFSEMSLVPIELKKCYRQSDPAFVSLLDKIRCNRAGARELALLNTRYSPQAPAAATGEFAITLATRRDMVDHINEERLAGIDGEVHTFVGKITDDFPDNSLPTPLRLELKTGAQIIFIRNDTEHRWVNGSLGIVSEINGNRIAVLLENGEEHFIEPSLWENIRYTYNEKEKRIEEKVIGSYRQYPVRLAWAITMHKCQGLTFNHVTIDFTGGTFAGGQAYVALSRCTSLNGITLTKPVTPRDIFVNPEIIRFSNTFNNPALIRQALQQAEADRCYHSAAQAFDNGDMQQCLDMLFKAMHLRYDMEKPVVRRYIQRKLGIINRLKEENLRLRNEAHSHDALLRKYALEYYEMGNECVVKAHDTRAALANYDKALSLDPTLVDAWVRKGITLADDGDRIKAMECLNRAVSLSPLNFKALYNRGKLRYECQDYEQALSDFAKAVARKPQHATAHERLGDTFMRLNMTDMAARHWSIAQDLREKKKKKP